MPTEQTVGPGFALTSGTRAEITGGLGTNSSVVEMLNVQKCDRVPEIAFNLGARFATLAGRATTGLVTSADSLPTIVAQTAHTIAVPERR